jgi:hypothetical protein
VFVERLVWICMKYGVRETLSVITAVWPLMSSTYLSVCASASPGPNIRTRGPDAIVSAFSRPQTVSSCPRFCVASTRLMPSPRAAVTQRSRFGTGVMLATSSSTMSSRFAGRRPVWPARA